MAWHKVIDVSDTMAVFGCFFFFFNIPGESYLPLKSAAFNSRHGYFFTQIIITKLFYKTTREIYKS